MLVFVYTAFLLCIGLCILCGYGLLWNIQKIPPKGTNKTKPKAIQLSIIIPARDEEHNLPLILESLRGQHEQELGEIIVVNDGSLDKTEEIARNAGVTVYTIQHKPSGWTGKNFACWYGAKHATGEHFLFVDADVRFESTSIKSILHEYQKKYEPITIQPYHHVKNWYEQWSLFFNIMIVAGIGAFTIVGKKLKPTGGCGPFLLIPKKDYFEIGGHEKTKDSILEIFLMGRLMRHKLHCYAGKGTVYFRMYPHGFSEVFEGWTKAFIDGATNTSKGILILSIAWLSGLIAAPLYCIGIYFLQETYLFYFSLITLFFAMMQLIRITRNVGNFSYFSIIFYPVYLMFFFILFFWSYVSVRILHRVTWKGRSIQRS